MLGFLYDLHALLVEIAVSVSHGFTPLLKIAQLSLSAAFVGPAAATARPAADANTATKHPTTYAVDKITHRTYCAFLDTRSLHGIPPLYMWKLWICLKSRTTGISCQEKAPGQLRFVMLLRFDC